MTEEEKNREVAEIDARIQDLNAHRSMWARAGGMGGAMAMKAVGELEDLQNKKYDILYGTHRVEIKELSDKIASIENANVVQKIRYGKLLKELRSRREELLNLDRTIENEREKSVNMTL